MKSCNLYSRGTLTLSGQKRWFSQIFLVNLAIGYVTCNPKTKNNINFKFDIGLKPDNNHLHNKINGSATLLNHFLFLVFSKK